VGADRRIRPDGVRRRLKAGSRTVPVALQGLPGTAEGVGTSPLKLRHIPKYGQLGRLLLAHRNATEAEEGSGSDADELVTELERLGPTYVKLGQLLSSRTDLLPEHYTKALSHLQDRVDPLPAGEGRRIVEEELGVRVSDAFATFEDEAMGSASLGQVHRATMRDGRPVAVKVQRPGVKHRVLEEMEVISELAEMVDDRWSLAGRLGLAASVEEFRRSLMAELDYEQEAANLRLFGDLLSDYDRLVIPSPIEDFTTARVLTMTFVEGRNISSMGPLALLELDGAPLAEQLFRAYLDQVLVHGVFHADPHPGNVLVTVDGRLGLIDLGMVARVAPDLQDSLLRLLVAASQGQGPEAAAALERLGEKLDDFDGEALSRRVSEMVLRTQGVNVADLQIGRELGELARAAAESGLRTPPELTLIGKALLNLDDVAKRLDDHFEPNQVIEGHLAHIMRHRMLRSASPTRLVTAALEGAEFAEQLPSRMNKVLDSLASGKFTLNIEGIDEKELMRGVQKLANRGSAGVVIAALVLSAAIFSVSARGPLLMGESAFTVIFLGLAFVVAGWVVVGTLRSDLPQRRRRREG
jgi:ubiquinone biosynthesis protein